MRRRGAALALALVVASAAACTGRRPPTTLPATGEGADAALYRARAVDENGRARRFRVWLWAARPDRFHAEVLSPVGTTVTIVDAAGQHMAVSFVHEREAFVGDDDGRAFDALLGLDLGVDDLVAALLDGRKIGGGIEIDRRPRGRGWPERIVVRDRGRTLELERRRLQRLAEGIESPGRGRPPEGFAVRPLVDLAPREIPGIDVDDAGGPGAGKSR